MRMRTRLALCFNHITVARDDPVEIPVRYHLDLLREETGTGG